MAGIDDFLQELVNQHQEKQTKSSNQISADEYNIMNRENDDIDNYLSQITKQSSSTKKTPITDNLFTEIEQNYQTNKTSISESSEDLLSDIESQFQGKKAHSSKSFIDDSFLDNSLRQIARHNEKKHKIQQEDKTVDNLQDIRQQELNKQKQVKLLERKAEEWLKNLDPNSEEGFWFEQFALSYESKKQAAIDYLKALS